MADYTAGAISMDIDTQVLAALTLVLAKQMRAEALAAGKQLTADPVREAAALIQSQTAAISGLFGIRQF
jgi:hypothetical protein